MELEVKMLVDQDEARRVYLRWSTHKRKSLPHEILWYGKKFSIALCVLTHSMCFLCLCGLGDSHGLTSRERFQVSIRGWNQVLVIMVDKGKLKITIPKDYMLEACG